MRHLIKAMMTCARGENFTERKSTGTNNLKIVHQQISGKMLYILFVQSKS